MASSVLATSATAFSSTVSTFMAVPSSAIWVGFCSFCRHENRAQTNFERVARVRKSPLTALSTAAESGQNPTASALPSSWHGQLMDDYEARLDELEQELKQAIAAPPPDLPLFLDSWLARLQERSFLSFAEASRRPVDRRGRAVLPARAAGVQRGRADRAGSHVGGAAGRAGPTTSGPLDSGTDPYRHAEHPRCLAKPSSGARTRRADGGHAWRWPPRGSTSR